MVSATIKQVISPLFNGGVFNGDSANILGTITADTVNAQNLNVGVGLSAPIINGTTTVISPLFNGGKFNGDEATITNVNVVDTLVSATINGTSTIISPLFNGGKFNGDEATYYECECG